MAFFTLGFSFSVPIVWESIGFGQEKLPEVVVHISIGKKRLRSIAKYHKHAIFFAIGGKMVS